jgi:unsaturated chondroitin disaccharide hydrolase
MKIYVILLFLIPLVFISSRPSDKKDDNLDKIVDNALKRSVLCLKKSVNEVDDRAKYPSYATKELKWKLETSKDWTSGFYPGTLWYAYELTKDDNFRKWALEWTAGIEKEKHNANTHDLGFRFNCSFGNGLRLLPGDTATRRYKEILLTAAATADSRFSFIAGQYPSSWDAKPLPNSIPAVVDVMMNLELLLWASGNGGDPKIKDRCITHSNTSYHDFVREDGGTFHVVRYDKTTGKILNKGQLQGDTDSSTWTRGHAWMVYGFTVMYRYTKNPGYLQKAMKLADYFIDHLPEDRIANWDFQSELKFSDASASAIVASALFEMQGYITDKGKKEHYLREAEQILKSLCLPPYFSEGKGTNCLLLHSTQYYRLTENTDVPSIFADYYFMESILRYKRLNAK